MARLRIDGQENLQGTMYRLLVVLLLLEGEQPTDIAGIRI